MTSFAAPADLAAYLQDAVDTASAQLFLDLASAAIRAAVRQTLSRVTDDVAQIKAPDGYELTLPQRPSDAPSAVQLGGVGITDYSVDTDADGRTVLYRSGGWVAWNATTGAPRRVQVTYSHGYTTIPDEIKRVCLQAAARAYRNPEGLRSETIGSYSRTYAGDVAVAQVDLTDAELDTLRQALGISSVATVSLG